MLQSNGRGSNRQPRIIDFIDPTHDPMMAFTLVGEILMPFSRAIARLPGPNLAQGLTTSQEGAPAIPLALEQHAAYCAALERCGLTVTVLPADPQFPDGCFVEDVAIVTPRGAIAMRPGAPSRQGEVQRVHAVLARMIGEHSRIVAPGTMDGGDICEADGHYLIGVSARTNVFGADQLAGMLADLGYSSDVVDIRSSSRLLHLKSGIAYLGDGRLIVTSDVPRNALGLFELIEVPENERYAANCVRVNDRVFVAAGYPATRSAIEECGYETIALEMSEYRKLDGGLSCLSLRL
jgi:dimethylargininase